MAPPPQNPQYQNPNNQGQQVRRDDGVSDGCLYVLAFFFPFIAVGIKRGGCSSEMWLCLLLFYFFWVPGVIYAFYIIMKDSEKRKAMDVEQMGQGYATQHQQPIQPHYNQQPLHQQQAYPTEGTYPQAAPPRHEPAPMAQPPVNHQAANSGIAPQAPPPTYAEGPTHPVNEKAQYVPN